MAKRSRILATVHATAKGLHAAGAIDQVTMREFDALNIKPVTPWHSPQIKQVQSTLKKTKPGTG